MKLFVSNSDTLIFANSGNQGCRGGTFIPAFRYILYNKGVDTEASYPYQERVSHTINSR